MAFQDFYMQTGGSNANSGSTNGTTPVWGNTSSVVWVGTTTSTLTVTDSSASAVQVGDLINVGGSYVSAVTGINATGAPTYVFTLSAAASSWGTEPAGQTYSSSGTVVDGGCWASLAQGVLAGGATVPAGTRVNVKAGTYSPAGAVTVSLVGATTKPIWFRGFTSSPGDLDAAAFDSGVAYPLISNTGQTAFSGAFTVVSRISFTGTPTTQTVLASGSPVRFVHCRFVNTNAAAGSYAFANNAACTLFCCYFKATATASYVVQPQADCELVGCYVDGPNSGSLTTGVFSSSGRFVAIKNTFNLCPLYGLRLSGGSVIIVNQNTFNGCYADSVRVDATLGNQLVSFADNTFFNSGQTSGAGYDVNNSTGTNSAVGVIYGNLSYNAKTGRINGFGDYPEFNALSDSSDPRTSSTDFHLVSTSNGYGAGIPGQWEDLTGGVKSTPSPGAWQSASAGGGGARIIGG